MIHASTVIFGLFALLWGGDALRIRRRASALRVLADSDAPVSDSHRFVCRKGVELDEATRRAASAFAREHGLSVIDIVPRDLPAGRALFLLQAVDLSHFRTDPTGAAASAGEAFLIDVAVLERMRQPDAPVEDVLAMCHLALRLKQYASMEMDFAVAPHMHTAPEDRARTRELIRFAFGKFAPPVVVVQSLLALAGPLLSPIAGGLALALMHLQTLVATLGTPLSPRGMFAHTLFRTPRDIAASLGAFAPPERTTEAVSADQQRTAYAKLLENGTEGFFEPRRDDCPLCGGRELRQKLTVGDRLQHKPGRFTLERCGGCGHIFQNPRLSIDGLNFYYRDFYDGLGEDDLEAVFRSALRSYRDRARMLRGVVEPSRWLDVGTGHGHFCVVARQEWPAAEFDGVDLTESVEQAERRRWIARGYRALFPAIAPELARQYDVVSMSHYLEHTREPRQEIEAAATALRPGGALLIEVPDPESRLGSLLGGWWLPWFQPQHQHLLSAKRLEVLLRASGFTPVIWHFGEAHQSVDFTFAAALLMHHLAPPVDRPWRERERAFARLGNRLLWLLAIPLLVLARVTDFALAPLLRRPRWSNTYRVVARLG